MSETNEECFECGSMIGLHNHHVVPKSLGGTKTIRLCEMCHGKIHGLDFTNHGVLIKNALRQLKLDGVSLGRPPGKDATDKILDKYPDVQALLHDNLSIRKVANTTGYGMSTIQRVKKLMNNEKN